MDQSLAKVVRQWLQETEAGTVLVLLAVFLFLGQVIHSAALLPEDAYHQAVIIPQVLIHLPQSGWNIPGVLIIVGVLLWRRKELWLPWSDFDHGNWLRVLVLAAAVAFGWPQIFYDYNFYYDRWHAIDRLLLLAGLAGCWWRPIFVLPVLVMGAAIYAQFEHPIGGLSWVVLDQPRQLLTMFAAFLLFSLATRARKSHLFLLLAGVVLVMHYWPSGYVKLRLGWLFDNHMQFLLPNTHANGWLSQVAPETLNGLTRFLAAVNPLILVFTVFVECAGIFLFWKRRFAIGVLCCWLAFHVGIFVFSGICFWQWMLVEAAFLMLVWRAAPFRDEFLFRRSTMLLAAVIVVTSVKWRDLHSLTWYDARASYTYRFYAIDEEERKLLPPRFFAPYDLQFSLNMFAYLSEEPAMDVTWGATTKQIGARLYQAKTTNDVLAVEAKFARKAHNPKRAQALADFISRFSANMNRQPQRKGALGWIQAPRVIWTDGGSRPPAKPIREIHAVQALTWFDRREFQLIRERTVLKVEVGDE